MKDHMTKICLTVITVVDIVKGSGGIISFFLWVGYGTYKLERPD